MSDPFSIASGVAGIVSLGLEVVKGFYEYYSTLKDQSSDIARIYDSLSRLRDLLGNLRRQLDARRFRSDEINVLACIEGRILQCKGCIEELKKVADKFNHAQNDGLKAAVKAKLRQAAYPFQQSTLQKLEKNVDSIFQQVFFSLQLLQIEDTSSIRNHVEDTKGLLELHRANNVAKDIHKWLDAPDATTNFNIAHEKSQPGTGAWLTDGLLFNDWLQRQNSFLWLYGFAGCGKSILCSTAIQHIVQHQKSSQDIGVAFFFFVFDDTGKQDASALLRALIMQLSGKESNTSLSSHLSRLYDSCRNSAPRNQALLDCLHRLSRSFKHTYIFIDALDESPRDMHRHDVLDVLTAMRGWMEPAVHLLVTSRDEVDIRDALEPSPEESIAVRNEASDKDIALYITQSLRNKPQLRKWKAFHGRIETTLTTQADGVFRWVDCQLREIAVCPRTEEHLDKLLSSLPRTLDDTYARMLLAIPLGFQNYARQMLMLLCCAKRHLTIEELIYGMAVDLDSIEPNSDAAGSNHVGSDNFHLGDQGPLAVFREKRKLNDPDSVLEVCPGFIELYKGPKREFDCSPCSYVRIAHFSVQEYLTSNRIKGQENVAQYQMQEQHINTQATRICLAILDKFDELAALEVKDPAHMYEYPLNMDEYPLECYIKGMFPWVCYAADFWPDHFRESREIPPEAVSAILRFRPYALRICPFNEPGDFYGYNPLQLATNYGLSTVVSVLLHEPTTDINETTGRTTALIVAVKARNLELARCFIDRNADVNACDGGALTTAAATGQVKIAKLLLDHGAKVNASAGKALDTASKEGHLEMIKLLVENGADVNANDEIALGHAAWGGNIEIAKLLLEHGAKVNAGGKTKLIWAASGNCLDMAKLLLEHGAEINAGDGEALRWAAWKNHLEMVEILLKNGADANLRETYTAETALWSAVGSRGLEVVRLLLDHGAEVNHCNFVGKTVLHKAAAIDREGIVRLLLDYGAKVNITNNENRTALFNAAKYGLEQNARLLLEGGADPNVVDKFGDTALTLAAKRDNKGIVNFLSNL